MKNKDKHNKKNVTLSNVTLSNVTLSNVTLSNVTLSGVEVGVEVGVEEQNNKKLITRKEAILKTGKYAALTAMATFVILSPKKAQAQSTPGDPGF